MNVSTGELLTPEELERRKQAMEEFTADMFEEVPEDLTLSAELELMGKDSTVVGSAATSKIATWARSKRDRLNIKAKSRKANKLSLP